MDKESGIKEIPSIDCRRVREMISDNVYTQRGKRVRNVVYLTTTLSGSDFYLIIGNDGIFGICELFEDHYELRF